jgi:hypothetical protein
MKNSVELAVVSLYHDVHAFSVLDAIKERHNIVCHLIPSDRLADTGGLSWEPTEFTKCAPTVPTIQKENIDVRRLSVLWWRRFNGSPILPETVTDTLAREVIINDCRSSLVGILDNSFQGKWVSHYESTRRAEIKPVQLKAAAQSGIRVPKTLISQDPVRIRSFCEELDYKVIVKPVAGNHNVGIATGKASPDLLKRDETLRLSPAIYQEMVEGTKHLRVHVFGEDVYTALMTSDHLDWRSHLDTIRIKPYQLPELTKLQLIQILKLLGLRMGIFDLKLTSAGEPVWLEVNPQGQFLFVEGLGGLKLTTALADFLVKEALCASSCSLDSATTNSIPNIALAE